MVNKMEPEPIESHVAAGPLRLNYGVACKAVDFGMLTARNQLISKVINPLLDMAIGQVKQDRAQNIGTGLRYTVNVVISAEYETVQ